MNQNCPFYQFSRYPLDCQFCHRFQLKNWSHAKRSNVADGQSVPVRSPDPVTAVYLNMVFFPRIIETLREVRVGFHSSIRRSCWKLQVLPLNWAMGRRVATRATTKVAVTAARKMTDLIPLVRATSSRLLTWPLTANCKGLNRPPLAATARHLWSRVRSRVSSSRRRCQVQKLGTTFKISFPVIPTLTDGTHLDIPPSATIYSVPSPKLLLLILRPSSYRLPKSRR